MTSHVSPSTSYPLTYLFTNLPPITGRLGLEQGVPSLIQDRDNLLRQGALFEVLQVCLQLAQTAHTDDDAVIAAISQLQQRVVPHPAQCSFNQCQIVLVHHRFDQL